MCPMAEGVDVTVCPGCGIRLPAIENAEPFPSASGECRRHCDELSFYTLALRDPFFIHQVVVDAYAAQHPLHAKPMTVAFALIGLCLLLQKNFTGREVRLAHMRYAHRRKHWPAFHPPEHRGEIRVSDVLSAPPGEERNAAIKRWAASVWDAWKESHAEVSALVEEVERI